MVNNLQADRKGQPISQVSKVLNDPERLEALAATGLLESPSEELFDRFTALASRILRVPVSAISLVTDDHQFFKSQVGLAEPAASSRRTPLSHSYCQFVVASAQALIVTDARRHPLLRDNPAIQDGAIAYLGVPLTTREGQTLGSFCTMDSQPRTWSDEDIETMHQLAGFLISEIELRLLARHFQGNFLHLRQLELERDELVHMLVHDLRNPLSSIISALEMIEDADTLAEARNYRRYASIGATSLLAMVNDILDVSKSEAGRLCLDIAPLAPRELIDLACSLVRQMSIDSGVSLQIDADPDLPIFDGDKEKLRRVLVNLVSNAIQHTPHGGHITVSARLVADRLVFSVADTGRGIPADAFSQIFEKFGKSPNRPCGRISSGLGLHFCKMTIEAHGGHIGIESELGKGTTFLLDLPLQQYTNGKA